MNDDKREPVLTKTRHLGFFIDLGEKMLSVTRKHSQKIFNFFNRFLMSVELRHRIRIKELQKMLGLQIWISTVFRVARQFLTSICDVIRVSGSNLFFYPRRHKALVSRMIFDLKFWRRFISSKPKTTFNALLGRLPRNIDTLACDACTSWGMAGVIKFAGGNPRYPHCEGLFWQMTWTEWSTVHPTAALMPGNILINEAEFLAALITCETFSEFCAHKLTVLEIDSTVAKAWLDSSRCPIHPFDRYAQATHLNMLKREMKIRTSWVTSNDNSLADICSREFFSAGSSGHLIKGVRLRKISPKWLNVIRFYKSC